MILRRWMAAGVLLVVIAGSTAALAAGSDDAPLPSPKHARHAHKANPPAITLGAALADPGPSAQAYRRAPIVAPATTEPSWTGFHVGVGVGGAR